MPYRAVPTLIAVLSCAAAASAADFSPLEPLIEAEMKRTQTPGCAIAIVMGDSVVYSRGFGVANVDTGEKVRPDTLFRIGSTTKMITAAAVASLAEEGRLKLDEPVNRMITGLSDRIGAVTLHQCLTHTAGLGDASPMSGPHDESALATTVRKLRDPLAFTEPGAIYSYSNPGYWIAGLAIETVEGKPYADVIAERVLKPVGMERSTFRPLEAMTWPLAVGHGPGGDGEPQVLRPQADNTGTWPAGQLYASAPEFARFCIAFMNGGKVDGKQALSPRVIELLSTPHVRVPGGDRRYGYALSIAEHKGMTWVSHGGTRAGYGSFVSMVPAKRFAVVMMCNRTGEHLERVVNRAAEIAIGASMSVRPRPKLADLTTDEAQRFAGTYSNGVTTVVLQVVNGKLRHTLGEVKKAGDDRLVSGEREYVIVTGEGGRVEYLVSRSRALRRK